MKAIFNPRKLTHLGQARGWAAVAFGVSSLDLTTARAEGGELECGSAVVRQCIAPGRHDGHTVAMAECGPVASRSI